MHLRPWQPQSLARSCFSSSVACISAVCQVCLGNENRRSFKTYGTGAGWVLPWIYALILTPWAEKWTGDPLQCPSVYVSPQELLPELQDCLAQGGILGVRWAQSLWVLPSQDILWFSSCPWLRKRIISCPPSFPLSLWSAVGQGCFKRRDGPSAAPKGDGAEEAPVPPGWNVSQLLLLWIHHFLDVPWDT